MPLICPHCNKKIVKYPIRDEQGKLIIKNLFMMDTMSVLFFITILLLLLGFAQTTAECKQFLEQPCDVCTHVDCSNNNIKLPKETFVPIADFDTSVE